MTIFRITPAYAGKRILPGSLRACSGDHPRVCGEKFSRTSCITRRKGSPPRMRGKVKAWKNEGVKTRITPAYAGKSSTLLNFSTTEWDHPRVCGEKNRSNMENRNKLGSPPRMRGKVLLLQFCDFSCRITPAYAGKSFGRNFIKVSPWDHPRVCGEKFGALHKKGR